MRFSRLYAPLLASIVLSSVTFSNSENAGRLRKASQSFEIRAVPVGPTAAIVNAAKDRVAGAPRVTKALLGSENRLVSFEFVNAENDKPGSLPTRFTAIYYNYTRDIAVIAEGDFAGRLPITVREAAFDPGIGNGEFEAAAEIIRTDPTFGPQYQQQKLEFYEPMPPVSNLDGERLVNFGVRNLDTGENQIVGVSFRRDVVVRYKDNAPPTSRAAPEGCGVPTDPQGPTGSGVPGQLQLTAMETGNTAPVWELLVVRPSSSSGATNERSGVEIRDVKYRGKSVLKRGHLPVLNVQYQVPNSCGPFRDWQYGESYLQIPNTGVTFPSGTDGGFAVIDSPGIATTVVETGNDFGNFRGVAVYQQNSGGVNEMVLVAELEAGWYRYIMEWRFGYDGRIRPRYGFGSTVNSCVCIQRNHHAYWRFDFDIVQPNNKVYMMERGKKFRKLIETESAFFRNYGRNRSIVIQNADGEEAYVVVPSGTDGTVTNAARQLSDTYGKGDFWLFKFQGTAANPTEINDPNTNTSINIDPWLTGESINNQDIVVWYGAHQMRKDDSSFTTSPSILTGKHVIGPELRPIRW